MTRDCSPPDPATDVYEFPWASNATSVGPASVLRYSASTKAPVAALYRSTDAEPTLATHRNPSGPKATELGLASPPLPGATNVPWNAPELLNRRTLFPAPAATYRLPSGPNLRPRGRFNSGVVV